MREKWRSLERLAQVMLIIQAVLLAVFTVIYPIVRSRTGIEYRGRLLARSVQGENTVYAGRADGMAAAFTVSPGGVVEDRHGEDLYGPYTVTLDPAAVPEGEQIAINLTGVEVRRGDEVIFRGGCYEDSFLMLWDENGTIHSQFSDGIAASRSDPSEPKVAELLQLVLAPEETRQGFLPLYWLGTFVAGLNALSICYADALFRWNLRFRIRDPEKAEPSEWELFGRRAGWIFLTALTFFIYLYGASFLF